MTREDIIKLAREAGFYVTDRDPLEPEWFRFAALVAAAEREKVARWQIGSGYSTGHGDTIEDLLVELEWQVRESEREACARLCDLAQQANSYQGSNQTIGDCAAAIRTRGQQKHE